MKVFLFFIFMNSVAFSFELFENETYLGFRHLHDGTAHSAKNYLKKRGFIAKPFISKGRVNVYQVKKKNFSYSVLPSFVKNQFFLVKKEDLVNRVSDSIFRNKRVDSETSKISKRVSESSYKKYVESLVKIGPRNEQGAALEYLVSELRKMNLNPIRTDYNVVSMIKGSSDNSLVVIGHMDTVSRTVGADDNASGAAGVLEMARVLSKTYKNKKPKHDIYFVLSEDEEVGLLGAKRFVKKMKADGKLSKIKLAINMDMIAYNKNKVLDLETSKSFKKVALFFAERVSKYTKLKSNLVLNPWGSDHMPFINAGVPAVLTIENWQTHTPCWHRSCDTLDTLNIDYALEVLKLNIAVIVDLNKDSLL